MNKNGNINPIQFKKAFVFKRNLLIHCSIRVQWNKAIGFWEDVCPTMVDEDFRRYFRMNSTTLRSLCQFLKAKKRSYQGGREQIPASKAVAITVAFLGSQLPYKQLSYFFGVFEYAFIRTTEYVMKLMKDKSQLIIKWPEKKDYADIAADFNSKRLRCFPNVIGCIDGCHIRIAAKKNERGPYYNYKRFHSVHLQVVCLNDRKFTDIFVG